jgi:DNA-binding NarL/FixJ family response regulator
MAAGCKEPEIAATMGITGYTVRFHVSNICRKLDAPNRSAAIYRAAKSSII